MSTSLDLRWLSWRIWPGLLLELRSTVPQPFIKKDVGCPTSTAQGIRCCGLAKMKITSARGHGFHPFFKNDVTFWWHNCGTKSSVWTRIQSIIFQCSIVDASFLCCAPRIRETMLLEVAFRQKHPGCLLRDAKEKCKRKHVTQIPWSFASVFLCFHFEQNSCLTGAVWTELVSHSRPVFFSFEFFWTPMWLCALCAQCLGSFCCSFLQTHLEVQPTLWIEEK